VVALPGDSRAAGLLNFERNLNQSMPPAFRHFFYLWDWNSFSFY